MSDFSHFGKALDLHSRLQALYSFPSKIYKELILVSTDTVFVYKLENGRESLYTVKQIYIKKAFTGSLLQRAPSPYWKPNCKRHSVVTEK